MKYKLVAVDMDGTLLDNRKIIPEANIDALYRARKNGVRVIFSTGRVLESALSYATAIDYEVDVVGSNGAITAYQDRHKSFHLPKDEVFRYGKKCEEIGLKYLIITEEASYYFNNFEYYHYFYKDNEMVQTSKVVEKEAFHSLEEIRSRLDRENIIKMDIFGTDPDKMKTAVRQINGEKVNVIQPEYNYIEMMHPKASKGNGVLEIAGYYGVHPKEIVTIGDSGNDISMFQIGGVSVAMGNAEASVKKHTKMTTDTNENCGVAKVLKQLALI